MDEVDCRKTCLYGDTCPFSGGCSFFCSIDGEPELEAALAGRKADFYEDWGVYINEDDV